MTIRHLFAFALVFSSTSAVQADDTKDKTAINGTWLPETAVLAGNPFPDEVRKTIRLEIKDDTYKVTAGEEADAGEVKIDPTAKPKTIDIKSTDGPNKGKTILAIYELDGDTLKVCYDLSGKARPKEFKSEPDTPTFLVTYKREKK